ncbi:hypothetical protein [Nocardioides fonticola]|uniref:hypothetical protein n=1 Tax=Nocardioides fonticola TaxID=450363 RepID=UPI0031D9D6ED
MTDVIRDPLDDERGGLLVEPFALVASAVIAGVVGGAGAMAGLWALTWRIAGRRAAATLPARTRGGARRA